jgi:hypothetical protein
MNPKTRNITGWILTALLSLVLLASAGMKLSGSEQIAKAAESFGISMSTIKMIGLIEILSTLLFIIPRTGVLGTMFLAAYMGGAIATHVEHQLPFLTPVLIECLIWITAAIRFPEITRRLMGKN